MPATSQWLPVAATAVLATLYGLWRLYLIRRSITGQKSSCHWMLGACAKPSFPAQPMLVTALVFAIAIGAFIWLAMILM
jgi:hypothetical protein